MLLATVPVYMQTTCFLSKIQFNSRKEFRKSLHAIVSLWFLSPTKSVKAPTMHDSLLGDSNREKLRAIQAGLFKTSSCIRTRHR